MQRNQKIPFKIAILIPTIPCWECIWMCNLFPMSPFVRLSVGRLSLFHRKAGKIHYQCSLRGCHSSAGSALSCGREFAGSNLQFAFVTSVSEQTLFCIPTDGIKLQSGGGHYSGCHTCKTCHTQWPFTTMGSWPQQQQQQHLFFFLIR